MSQKSKWTALLATIRTPNIPSVACNVLTGSILASIAAPLQTPQAISAIASGVLLYLAGNLLNDWHDRDWDALHRPERALPQKIFQPSSYLTLAIACSLAGLATAAANPRSLAIAAIILGLILIYTKSHKSSALAIIPMGLCRAFLPMLGYCACSHQSLTSILILMATALLIHTCGLSLVARSESKPDRHPSRLFLYGYPLAVAITCLAAHISSTRSIIHLWPAALPYLLWTFLALFLLRRSAFTGVSMLLAGIPLVDWTFLIPFAKHPDASLPWLALCAPPIAFILGKSLQKIVPAT
jgi:heme O synthase-like polyprenyltransferase